MALLLSRRLQRLLKANAPAIAEGARIELSDLRSARELLLVLSESLPRQQVSAQVSAWHLPSAAELHGLGLLDDACRRLFVTAQEPDEEPPIRRILRELDRRLGPASVTASLRLFAQRFGLSWTPTGEASGKRSGSLSGRSGKDGREEVLADVLATWLARINPTAQEALESLVPFDVLDETQVRVLLGVAEDLVLGESSPLPGIGDTLLGVLNSPSGGERDSLAEQIEYTLARWTPLLGPLVGELRVVLGALMEESAPRFGPGPGPVEVPAFDPLAAGEARYSSDAEWMQGLVLQAKNALVWLHQLSTRYGMKIDHLDQVPERALAALSRQGITGLWLIGIFERSPASRDLKRLTGNPEAIGSAYSIRRYSIARSLGGDAALEAFSERALAHGIRLAADVVPNHMGLDSDWVLRYPERFIGQSRCPFPGYSFSGPDLSPDPDISLQVEDHYYDQSDAAVVFKRTDRRTGEARYIYHGNDGTSTPWNDTAQLDFRLEEVREAVLEEIVSVARRFPVVRFDAAMTLARRHFQRLWFPAPGEAGAIPSRAEHGLSREQFEATMPEEFWRQVVDRVARDASGTLLLAEAFWLMEGFFVRTLGLHRVYNSAFMHMLRDGRNADYRKLLRETLAFDPEILHRYVNFLSNPDERSARDQFGDEDRYFGVTTLAATLPGLPMFAHGQIEGLRERYGMEFFRPLEDEVPDRELMARHDREIAPLLHRRKAPASGENFHLLEMRDAAGSPLEDVIASSQGVRGEALVVMFNNTATQSGGWLGDPGIDQTADTGSFGLGSLLPKTLGDETPILFRSSRSDLEFLRRAGTLREKGLFLDLRGFACEVLEGFAPAGHGEAFWVQLERGLSGRGVHDLAAAVGRIRARIERLEDLEHTLPWPPGGRSTGFRDHLADSMASSEGLRSDLLGVELMTQLDLDASVWETKAAQEKAFFELALEGEWFEAQPAPGLAEIGLMLEAWGELPSSESINDLLLRRGALAALGWLRQLESAERERQDAADSIVGWFEALGRVEELAAEVGFDVSQLRRLLTPKDHQDPGNQANRPLD